MHHSDVILFLMKEEGFRQIDLAKQIGAKSQSVISERINYKTIGIKPLLELLDAMGYEIVVRQSYGDYAEGEYPIRLKDYLE